MFSLNWRSEYYKTAAFFYRNVLITKRNVFTVFETLFWPLVTLFAVGLMGSYLDLTQDLLVFILIGAITLSVWTCWKCPFTV